MKKTSISIFLVFISMLSFSQDTSKKIIKISYTSVPISLIGVDNRVTNSIKRANEAAVLGSHKTYYTLLINIKSRASIYYFDSLVFNKPKGQEKSAVSIADEVKFCIKPIGNNTFKYETVMDQLFLSKGTVGDIEWIITNEKKVINGFECTKAVAKNKDLMLFAWFTSALPVSSGPSIYLGLPGLVVWVEDFFRTTQIEKITYNSDTVFFDKQMVKFQTDFGKTQKRRLTEESVVIFEKANLAKFFYKMFNPEVK